jgi:alkylation response protein AidB-like acyl-CoA dehydrogenase
MSTVEEKTLEQKIMLENLRKFLEKELRPLLSEMDQKNFFPREIYQKLGEMGFLGAYYPQEYGGSETDLMTYFQIIEEIARFDAGFSMSVFASTVLFGRNVLLHGSEQQKRKYLPPLASIFLPGLKRMEIISSSTGPKL